MPKVKKSLSKGSMGSMGSGSSSSSRGSKLKNEIRWEPGNTFHLRYFERSLKDFWKID